MTDHLARAREIAADDYASTYSRGILSAAIAVCEALRDIRDRLPAPNVTEPPKTRPDGRQPRVLDQLGETERDTKWCDGRERIWEYLSAGEAEYEGWWRRATDDQVAIYFGSLQILRHPHGYGEPFTEVLQ